jgi:uncharacterized linocin/CFP29 family protein
MISEERKALNVYNDKMILNGRDPIGLRGFKRMKGFSTALYMEKERIRLGKRRLVVQILSGLSVLVVSGLYWLVSYVLY